MASACIALSLVSRTAEAAMTTMRGRAVRIHAVFGSRYCLHLQRSLARAPFALALLLAVGCDPTSAHSSDRDAVLIIRGQTGECEDC